MGLLDRFRSSPQQEPWRPRLPGQCACTEHVDALGDLLIEATPPVPVGEVAEAVTVIPADEHYLYGATTGQRRGPYEWRLSYTLAVARLYDDDAPAQIDDMLFIQAGVDKVLRIDGATLAVGAATLCERGIAAAFFQALANPRVRRD